MNRRRFLHEEGKFLCCLSRLRHTPYWTIPEKKRTFDARKHERNEAMKEHDHRPLREALIAVVRETPLKVLLCPEDRTQMAVGKEMFWDKLPDDRGSDTEDFGAATARERWDKTAPWRSRLGRKTG